MWWSGGPLWDLVLILLPQALHRICHWKRKTNLQGWGPGNFKNEVQEILNNLYKALEFHKRELSWKRKINRNQIGVERCVTPVFITFLHLFRDQGTWSPYLPVSPHVKSVINWGVSQSMFSEAQSLVQVLFLFGLIKEMQGRCCAGHCTMDHFLWILPILSKFHNNYEMPGLLDFVFS